MTTTADVMSHALQHQAAGQWKQSETLCRQILATDPDHADAHNNQGIALFCQCKIVEATFCFRRAIYFGHDFLDAVHNLAKACYAQEYW